MAGVNALVQRLERLAASDIKQRILAKVRDAAHAECIRGFNEKRDPYGTKWEPRKPPTGGWPLLDKTGKGIESLTARVVGDRVVLRIVYYFKFHQTGTTHYERTNVKTQRTTRAFTMPARKIFPDTDRGLGMWREPIQRASVDAVRDLMAGRV